MLTSIHPLGERARQQRWGRTAAAYVLASIAGGSLAGVLAGGLGALLRAGGLEPVVAAAIGGAGAVAAAVLETGRFRPALPGPHRQVDEDWLHRYRGWVYGAGFGFQLGLGVATIVTSAAVHLTLALAVLSGSPGAGAAVGATFGLVRAAPVLGTAGIHRPGQLRSAHRRVVGAGPSIRRAATAVLAGQSAVLAAAVVTHA